MNTKLMNNLNKLCLEFIKKYEEYYEHHPIGTCYVIGHCLSEGLKKVGYTAKEVTGTLILKDKHEKNIIYGKSIVKGHNIGYYHTWCVLEVEGEEIIVDPSFKYNKQGLKNDFQIKLNPRIPDIIITSESSTWLITYIKDDSLVHLSKNCLNKLNTVLVEGLINKVEELVKTHLGTIENVA